MFQAVRSGVSSSGDRYPNANRPLRRTLLALSAASFVLGAVVCATLVLSAGPNGLLLVVAGLSLGSLVAAVAAGNHRKRNHVASSAEDARPDPSTQPQITTTSSLPPRQTSDDYWYPAAATRDRTGTRHRGPGR